jgi:hypothetical protein
MIEVSRLKDLNAAKLFLGFRIGAISRRDFAVFSSTRSTQSPEAEEVRQQDVRWCADGRCAQKHSSNVACRSSSVIPSNFPGSMYPKQMYFIVLILILVRWVGPARTAVANFSVTVSSNEAQHILI